MANEPRVAAPGLAAYRLYVWAMLASPLLLLVASLALLVVGLARESEGVATVGAVGIVAALILPRTKGPVELGPGGFKGGTLDEFFDYAWRRGVERGLPPDEAREVALEAVSTESEPPQWPNLERELAKARISGRIDEALRFKDDVRLLVEAAIQQKPGWRRSDRVIEQDPPYGAVDFVIETEKGLVLVETQTHLGGNTGALKRFAFERAIEREQPYRAFLVTPTPGVSAVQMAFSHRPQAGPREDYWGVGIDGLLRALMEL